MLALVLATGFARLGVWQLDRAATKEARAAACAAATRAPRLGLDRLPREVTGPALRCRPVTGRAEVSDEGWLLLDNQVHRGRAGYLVYAPARLADGRWLLLEQGFVAVPDRRRLPEVRRAAGPRRVEGFLAPPPVAGIRLADDPGVERLPGGWLRVQRIDPQALATASGRRFLPVVLRREPPTGIGGLSPARHRAYAAQWFALAAAVLLTAAVLLVRGRRRWQR